MTSSSWVAAATFASSPCSLTAFTPVSQVLAAQDPSCSVRFGPLSLSHFSVTQQSCALALCLLGKSWEVFWQSKLSLASQFYLGVSSVSANSFQPYTALGATVSFQPQFPSYKQLSAQPMTAFSPVTPNLGVSIRSVLLTCKDPTPAS